MSLNTSTSVGTSEPERLKLSSIEIERVPTFKLLVFGNRKICVGTITSTRRLRRQTRGYTIYQMWVLQYTVRRSIHYSNTLLQYEVGSQFTSLMNSSEFRTEASTSLASPWTRFQHLNKGDAKQQKRNYSGS